MKFVKEFLIRIEGETSDGPFACGSLAMERHTLENLHATQFLADEVERFWQTNLAARKVTVIPLDRPNE